MVGGHAEGGVVEVDGEGERCGFGVAAEGAFACEVAHCCAGEQVEDVALDEFGEGREVLARVGFLRVLPGGVDGFAGDGEGFDDAVKEALPR